MDKPTVIDLFCGAGGMSHGFSQAGFRIVAGIDNDKDALATFRANHAESRPLQVDLSNVSPKQLADVLDVLPGSLDCIVGGPPCQGFSRNRAFNHVDGVFVDDPRNYLYWHFFEYVDYFRPKVVVMENVPEMLIRVNGGFKEAVLARFAGLGYHVEARVLNAAEFGVPQWRRRAFFVAGRDHQVIKFPDPITRPGPRAGSRTPNSADYVASANSKNYTLPLFGELPIGPTVWDAIGDLYGEYAPSIKDSCRYSSEPSTEFQRARRSGNCEVSNHFRWPLTERQLQRVRLLKEGQGLLHLPPELQTKNGYGSAYRRMQADAQALTLTTWLFHPGSGMFTHPYEHRVVTIREAARLQSFQDRFTFLGSYHSQCKQVGNSVAPLIAFHLAQTISHAL
jgi:DNA (cytosine-5)-methyltransferase 1